MDEHDERIIAEFRAQGGTITSAGKNDRGHVLVHHIGAKTGIERVTPLITVREGDSWYLIASNRGSTKHPGWYHNLMAHPDVDFEYPGEDGTVQTVGVHVDEVGPDQWPAVFARFVERASAFEGYLEKAKRHIPILRVTPRG